ncbi:ribonuclease P protein component [Cellulophaga omnivescoria]|uniref:ribonuclease P protein component n=1 Tax=Cellulophaga omnivescoria TaxID=1888890 RepID=UPI000987A1DC|nr:ribonuclease P protein component [Cellulophaga omnivescoria]WBU90645.1 ribonuclease P protein component [Cellulophaga omnivescoria]WKB82778.1 ribonuclease P protein component [Cellulophaga lytica]
MPTQEQPNTPNFKFPTKEKLKSKKLIGELFENGKSVSSYPVKLIYLPCTLENTPLKVGVTVPKRNFKSAVDRNRIKRLLREGYRLNKHVIFNNIDKDFALLFLYLGKKKPNHTEIEKSVAEVLAKFYKKVNNEERT